MFSLLGGLFANTDKTKLLNTIGLWLLILMAGYWVFLREDPNELNKQTVDKLVVAVDKFSEASNNLTEVALKQREWSSQLEQQIAKQNELLERSYSEMYKRYQYNETDSTSSLDDLYARQLFVKTERDGSGDLRGNENGVGKTSTVQKPTTRPEKHIN